MKHQHYDCIVAWAEGKQIQSNNPNLDGSEDWEDETEPRWYNYLDYRIKPEPKPDVVKYLICGLKSWVEVDDQVGHECIKIVIDGKGRLKSAEVI
jgi:hypothetical protein